MTLRTFRFHLTTTVNSVLYLEGVVVIVKETEERKNHSNLEVVKETDSQYEYGSGVHQVDTDDDENYSLDDSVVDSLVGRMGSPRGKAPGVQVQVHSTILPFSRGRHEHVYYLMYFMLCARLQWFLANDSDPDEAPLAAASAGREGNSGRFLGSVSNGVSQLLRKMSDVDMDSSSDEESKYFVDARYVMCTPLHPTRI
jgi:hypothetical protein